MPHLGEVTLGETLYFWVNTHNPSTGAAQAPSGDVSFSVYEEDDTDAIVTGSMSAVGSAGHYVGSLAVLAAAGFGAGKAYCIRIAASVTVDEESLMGADLQTFRVVAPADPAMILPAEEE